MEDEFSPEEIDQIVRAARVWAPGFTQEQLQQLVDSQHRLADPGFPEAAWGVVRLEQEKGIHCTEALDAYRQLLQDKTKLEQKIADREAKLETVGNNIRQAEDRYQQVKGELAEVKAERERQEKELAAFRKKADKEKRAIEKELVESREKANVSKEEATIAGLIKGQVENCGFSLDLVLRLSQEFKGYEDIVDKVAEGLKRGLTLTKCNEEAAEQNERLKSDLSRVQSEIDKGQANYNQLEGAASKLRTEIAGNGEIVSLYHRYRHLRPLLEYLGSWYVNFFHCNWCGCLFWMLKVGNTKKTRIRCPWCGLPMVEPDRAAYAASGHPPDTEIQLLPGE